MSGFLDSLRQAVAIPIGINCVPLYCTPLLVMIVVVQIIVTFIMPQGSGDKAFHHKVKKLFTQHVQDILW